MPIWKITPEGPAKISKTKPSREKLLENHLEDWIEADPSFLGEPLFIIGRQVIIPDVKDRVDLLALDPQGNAVIVELKRGKLKAPVDMQALRYASYVSKWQFEDFENQAKGYFPNGNNPDFNFNQAYQQFCSDAGIDEAPDLNTDQRIILVGSEIRDKLGSVALWLREHNIDIKVIEVEAYKEGETVLVEPHVIIPLPVSKFIQTGRAATGDLSRPWRIDGQRWHLEKKCSKDTRPVFLELNQLIQDNFDVESSWNQKLYVSYRVGSFNWLFVHTRPNTLSINLIVKKGSFSQRGLARKLGIKEFEKEESLSEKFSLPSSVAVRERNERTDRITIRIKKDFKLQDKAFLEFLKKAHTAFSRSV